METGLERLVDPYELPVDYHSEVDRLEAAMQSQLEIIELPVAHHFA